MSLDQQDLELIERIVYKNSDDIAVSIARSFERLEERTGSTESKVYSRLADIEDKIECTRQDISDNIGEIKDEVRELAMAKD